MNDTAQELRVAAARLRSHALRYLPHSVYRKGDMARAAELDARADALDPQTWRTAGQAMAGVLAELGDE